MVSKVLEKTSAKVAILTFTGAQAPHSTYVFRQRRIRLRRTSQSHRLLQRSLEQDIANAVTVLQNGGVVVFPTETAYGLAADATNPAAVNRVFAIKGRGGEKSLPLIAGSQEMVERYAEIPQGLQKLASEHWPGPLTLVLPVVDGRLAAGVVRDGAVAVRVSSHPVARALSEGLDRPIVSTSANRSGQPTCYSVKAVKAQLGDMPDLYIDTGMLIPEPPSTIVAIDDSGYPEVVREGSITLCTELSSDRRS